MGTTEKTNNQRWQNVIRIKRISFIHGTYTKIVGNENTLAEIIIPPWKTKIKPFNCETNKRFPSDKCQSTHQLKDESLWRFTCIRHSISQHFFSGLFFSLSIEWCYISQPYTTNRLHSRFVWEIIAPKHYIFTSDHMNTYV